MIKFLKDTSRVLGSHKRHFFLMLPLILCSSILDMISLGLISPLIAFFADPGTRNLGPFIENLQLITGFETNSIRLIAGALLLVFIFKIALLVLFQWIVINFAMRVQKNIRIRLMTSFQTMNYEDFIQDRISNYVNCISVLTTYFTNNVLVHGLRACGEFIVITTLVSYLVYTQGTIILGLGLFLLGAVFAYQIAFRGQLSQYGRRVNVAQASMIASVQESMEGLKEVRILGKDNFFRDELKSSAEEYADLHGKSVFIGFSFRLYVELLLILAFVFVVFIIAPSLAEANADFVSKLGVLGFAAFRILPALNVIAIGFLNIRLQTNTVSQLRNALELEDTKHKRQMHSAPTKKKLEKFQILQVHNASYTYPGTNSPSLNGVSLKIKSGEKIGIIGTTGAGKSTLVDMLIGLLKPQTGMVTVNGIDLTDCIDDWHNAIAYIPQESFVINRSVFQNISVEQEVCWDEKKIKSALDLAGLSGISSARSLTDEDMGDRGVRLSGGQRQRLAIARAIYHDRDMLIFDESTSALDMITEDQIMDSLDQMGPDKTMIFISHRVSSLKRCDRIYEIKNGKISSLSLPVDTL